MTENMGLLVLFTCAHLYDDKDLKEKFDVHISYFNLSCYNLEVFECTLRYIGVSKINIYRFTIIKHVKVVGIDHSLWESIIF